MKSTEGRADTRSGKSFLRRVTDRWRRRDKRPPETPRQRTARKLGATPKDRRSKHGWHTKRPMSHVKAERRRRNKVARRSRAVNASRR